MSSKNKRKETKMQCTVCLSPLDITQQTHDVQAFRQLMDIFYQLTLNWNSHDKVCHQCYATVATFDQFIDRVERAHLQLVSHSDRFCGVTSSAERVDAEQQDQNVAKPLSQNETVHHELADDNGDDEDKEEIAVNPTDTIIAKVCQLICEICKLECSSFSMLRVHYRTRHNCKCYVICCGRKFAQKQRLYEHARKHLNPKEFTCDLCNRTCASGANLKQHVQTMHHGSSAKRYQCDECCKAFISSARLSIHKRCHVALEKRGYQCDYCKRRFGTAYTLRYHVGYHHEDAHRFVCDICGKRFYRKYSLEHHLANAHCVKKVTNPVESERVSCPVCSKSMLKRSLRKHLEEHQDTKTPYQCDICGKPSYSKGAHLEHKRFMHVLQKVHKCVFCDKAFKRAVTLKEHLACHTGQPLYTCTLCSKTFNSNGNLYTHRKKYHHMHGKEAVEELQH